MLEASAKHPPTASKNAERVSTGTVRALRAQRHRLAVGDGLRLTPIAAVRGRIITTTRVILGGDGTRCGVQKARHLRFRLR